MSWWARLFSRGSPPDAPATTMTPPAISAETLPQYIANTVHLTAPAAIERLRQARMQLGDSPELLLALARRQPDDAPALWALLVETHPAEAFDALADSALDAATRQAYQERAAAVAPGDMSRLRQCVPQHVVSAPQLPVGHWPPLVDRLPARFAPVKPIARGIDGLILQVTDGQSWAAKGLFADRAEHPQLSVVFETLKMLRDADLPGLATITHLDCDQGVWVRTAGVSTLEYAQRAPDLTLIEQALNILHADGLAHGNLCPRNIIIDAAGQARLTDWGVARLRGVEPSIEADTIAWTALREAWS